MSYIKMGSYLENLIAQFVTHNKFRDVPDK